MVKRFDVDREYVGDGEYIGAMKEDMNGDYVSYEDYEELRQKLETIGWLVDKIYKEL